MVLGLPNEVLAIKLAFMCSFMNMSINYTYVYYIFMLHKYTY